MFSHGKNGSAPPKYCVSPIALLSNAASSSAHAVAGQKRGCRPMPTQMATASAAPSHGSPSRNPAHQGAAVPQAATAISTLAAANAAAQRGCGAANSASTAQQLHANSNGCTDALGPAANGLSQGSTIAVITARVAARAAGLTGTETFIEQLSETPGSGDRGMATPP